MKHLIWSNTAEEISAVAEDIRNDNPDACEDEVWNMAHDEVNHWLDDELSNLDIDVGGEIIAFGDLGLWNGRLLGYRMLGSNNLRDCINAASDGDVVEWYVEDGDVKIREDHHDGTNFLTFRAWKNEKSPVDRDVLLFMIRNAKGNARGTLWEDINRLTRPLGEYVAKVYGWPAVDEKKC